MGNHQRILEMNSYTIVIDSREQREWSFDHLEDIFDVSIDTVVDGLTTGDYTLEGCEDNFAVERKSLDDLVGCSYGEQKERFERELERGQEMDNFALLVESPRRDIYRFKGRSNNPNWYASVHPNCVIGALEAWKDRYNLDIRYAEDRDTAAIKCWTLLTNWS